jgi:mRNA-degrading endonuclease RelE of RelBE toxin-antitoxin system
LSWRIVLSSKAAKLYRDLPEQIKETMIFLIREIELLGPVRGTWKNYGKLGRDSHHCHLKSGHPTYVACWRVLSKTERFVEVYYVGSHEKAPY